MTSALSAPSRGASVTTRAAAGGPLGVVETLSGPLGVVETISGSSGQLAVVEAISGSIGQLGVVETLSGPLAVVETLNGMFGDGAALAAGIAAYLWVKMFDLLASREVLDRKLSRKLIHTSCGPFFMLTWPLFSSMPEARYFAALVPLLQGVRLVAIGSGWIKNESAIRAVSREGSPKELLRGPLFYTTVMVACTAIFWRTSVPGVAALSLMCGGDGLADIVGRRLGEGNKLFFNKNKSFAGSAAMFIGGFGLSCGLTAVFHSLGYLDVTAAEAAGRLAIIAAACTIVEALPLNTIVDDNISVPVVALVVGGLLFQ